MVVRGGGRATDLLMTFSRGSGALPLRVFHLGYNGVLPITVEITVVWETLENKRITEKKTLTRQRSWRAESSTVSALPCSKQGRPSRGSDVHEQHRQRGQL